jgi:hypothetical protein
MHTAREKVYYYENCSPLSHMGALTKQAKCYNKAQCSQPKKWFVLPERSGRKRKWDRKAKNTHTRFDYANYYDSLFFCVAQIRSFNKSIVLTCELICVNNLIWIKNTLNDHFYEQFGLQEEFEHAFGSAKPDLLTTAQSSNVRAQRKWSGCCLRISISLCNNDERSTAGVADTQMLSAMPILHWHRSQISTGICSSRICGSCKCVLCMSYCSSWFHSRGFVRRWSRNGDGSWIEAWCKQFSLQELHWLRESAVWFVFRHWILESAC